MYAIRSYYGLRQTAALHGTCTSFPLSCRWLRNRITSYNVCYTKLLRAEEALQLIEESLKMDRFNFGAVYEKYLISGDKAILADLKALMRGYVHNFIEFALDYAFGGMYGRITSYNVCYTKLLRKIVC